MHRQTQHPRSKKKKYLPLIKKSSLPDCRENYSHRGAGFLSSGALAHSKLMPSVEEKENIFHHKKVASRIVMKTLHTVERGCREA
jgi:hypothetical protein